MSNKACPNDYVMLQRLLLVTAFICCSSATARAATVLFSDVPPSAITYSYGGWEVQGSGCCVVSITQASLFTVAGTGSEPVSEIDLAVFYDIQPSSFYASIWTNNSGIPGTQVPGAYWTLSSNTQDDVDLCCAPVSITGISGVTLTGGTSYFMVLGPVSLTDNSHNFWAQSIFGVGLQLESLNGGSWLSSDGSERGAFDVLSGTSVGVPEPDSVLLLSIGLTVLAAVRKATKILRAR